MRTLGIAGERMIGWLRKFFTRTPRVAEKVNVGKSVASLIFRDSGTYGKKVTRIGRTWEGMDHYQVVVPSSDVLWQSLNRDWILADNDIVYNRAAIHHYTVEHEDHWVVPE